MKEEIKIPIEQFSKEFKEEYNFLYKHNDKVAGYEQALNEFDSMLKNDNNFKKFVGQYVEYRQDFLSSDRECVAFMFALEKYM